MNLTILRREKKEKTIRESMIKRAAYQKIESRYNSFLSTRFIKLIVSFILTKIFRLAEERERIAMLSADVAEIKAEVKKLTKKV